MKYIILLFLIFSTKSISACKCGDIPNVKDCVKHSDFVFSGKVISKILTSDYKKLISFTGDTTTYLHKLTYYPMRVIKVKLTKTYKGISSCDTVTIITGPNGASCGFNFEIGSNYIIYGYKKNMAISSNNYSINTVDNKTYWTHQCSRTDYFSDLEESEIITATK